MNNKDVKIIAGPCSVDNNNIDDIEDILNIQINNQRAVAGVRVVGLKSRTSFNENGEGMGIDFDAFMQNLNIKDSSKFVDLPSVLLMKKLHKKYENLVTATEVMDTAIQLPLLDKYLKNHRVMVWNPSVNQLGWPVLRMSQYCKQNDWLLGLKNAKNLGGTLVDSEDKNTSVSLEKVWSGLVEYAQMPNDNKILIHRGVDAEGKGNFRNAPVHKLAERVKKATRCKLYFDPSHSYGPKLRDQIPQGIIESLLMQIDKNNYLYDGILVEAGNSVTDTEQHITVQDLKEALKEVSKFRDLII